MSGILDKVLNSQGGIDQLAQRFGISGEQATQAVSNLLPGLSKGVKDNIASPQGLQGLLQALGQGNHEQYLDQPERLASDEAATEGNNILGHILGGKEASRALASDAAAKSGLDSGLLQRMLPVVATMLMGGLAKQGASMGGISQLLSGGAGSTGMASMLGSFLDTDKDGSVVDDVLGFAKKLF